MHRDEFIAHPERSDHPQCPSEGYPLAGRSPSCQSHPAMLSLRALLIAGILAAGCDTEVRDAPGTKPQVDTEATLSSVELEKRTAYTSEAKIQRVAISYLAGELNLCEELGDGSVGPTPPLEVDCNASPKGDCVAVAVPSAAFEYEAGLWDTGVWKKIDYSLVGPTRYHFGLTWKTQPDGSCENRVKALGDLDADGIFSTFEAVSKMPGPKEWGGQMTRETHALE